MKKARGKIFVSIATLGIFIGNLALVSSCSWGMYEPNKPDILKVSQTLHYEKGKNHEKVSPKM